MLIWQRENIMRLPPRDGVGPVMGPIRPVPLVLPRVKTGKYLTNIDAINTSDPDLDKETRNRRVGIVRGLKGLYDLSGQTVGAKKSNPKKNEKLIKYTEHRNELFRQILRDSNPQVSRNAALLAKCDKILEEAQEREQNGLLDAESFQQLTNLIREAKAGNETANEEKIKEFDKRKEALNKQLLDIAEKQGEESDQMMKWRALQLVLLVTPFMGLSVMGPVMHVFSGAFMNAGGLGEGIASLATSEYTGPFGYFCELLHIDEAIRWLLCDSPVVSNLVAIPDAVISSDIAQGLLGNIVAPFGQSTTGLLAVAFLYNLVHTKTELEYREKYKGQYDGYKEAMKAEMDKIAKEAESMPGYYDPNTKQFAPWNVKSFVERRTQIMQNFHRKVTLADYAMKKFEEVERTCGVNLLTEVMSDPFMDALNRAGNGRFNAMNVPAAEFINFLNAYPDQAKEFYEKVLLFRALENESRGQNAGVANLPYVVASVKNAHRASAADKASMAKAVQAEESLLLQDFYLQVAASRGIDCSKVPAVDPTEQNSAKKESDIKKRGEAVTKVAAEIQKEEVKFFESNPYGKSVIEGYGKKEIEKHILPVVPSNASVPRTRAPSPLSAHNNTLGH